MAALEGKKDVLAENDAANRRRMSGGGGSGGSGGGGGGGGGGFFGDGGFEKWKAEVGSTLQASAIVIGGIVLFTSWRQLFALLVNAVFWLFRIPTGAEEAAHSTKEEAVVAKWGSSEEDE